MRVVAAVITAVWILAASVLVTGCERTADVERIVPSPARTKLKKRAHPTPQAENSPVPLRTPSRATAPGSATQLVKMSWYGYGPGTASGQAFSRAALKCAAIDRIPMLSHWKLRNRENGRVVEIVVNDRGQFEVLGRTFDCTPGVWAALGFALGRGEVSVEAIAA